MHRKTPKFSRGSAPRPRACAAGAGASPQTPMLRKGRYAPDVHVISRYQHLSVENKPLLQELLLRPRKVRPFRHLVRIAFSGRTALVWSVWPAAGAQRRAGSGTPVAQGSQSQSHHLTVRPSVHFTWVMQNTLDRASY
jgi:hypothetical protein